MARKKYAPTKKIRALVVHKKAMDVLGISLESLSSFLRTFQFTSPFCLPKA
jgi:hypothetical protein